MVNALHCLQLLHRTMVSLCKDKSYLLLYYMSRLHQLLDHLTILKKRSIIQFMHTVFRRREIIFNRRSKTQNVERLEKLDTAGKTVYSTVFPAVSNFCSSSHLMLHRYILFHSSFSVDIVCPQKKKNENGYNEEHHPIHLDEN